MEKSDILEIFITQLNDFFQDIYRVFENDKKILFAKDAIFAFSKINPKKTIKIWKYYAVDPYREQIDKRDFTFFLEKDYSEDVSYLAFKDSIIAKIDELRCVIKDMEQNNIDKAIKYVENLVKLCDLYYEE